MDKDPTTTNSELYKTVFENDRVRVLEYRDRPGDSTTSHRHPDSIMYTLSNFRRRLVSGDREVDVEIAADSVRWLDAQEHSGHNIGETETHVIFVELKEPPPGAAPNSDTSALGPES
ncbi:MAG: cytoplasmic protein [Actinomycetota bacterium]|nr:cytoplasmic protein [Actinomycetota bacterium]